MSAYKPHRRASRAGLRAFMPFFRIDINQKIHIKTVAKMIQKNVQIIALKPSHIKTSDAVHCGIDTLCQNATMSFLDS
jgi:hypothetical protein